VEKLARFGFAAAGSCWTMQTAEARQTQPRAGKGGGWVNALGHINTGRVLSKVLTRCDGGLTAGPNLDEFGSIQRSCRERSRYRCGNAVQQSVETMLICAGMSDPALHCDHVGRALFDQLVGDGKHVSGISRPSSLAARPQAPNNCCRSLRNSMTELAFMLGLLAVRLVCGCACYFSLRTVRDPRAVCSGVIIAAIEVCEIDGEFIT
jgi:hypothetical protein